MTIKDMNSEEMKKNLNEIIDYYGEDAQLEQLREETEELADELDDIDGCTEITLSAFGEMADELVMLLQFSEKHPIILAIMKFKINRQLVRIAKDKDDKLIQSKLNEK